MNFVPGSGSEIGDLIVTHPQIRFISFTGSKEVGLRINELAAKPQPGQNWIKRVVAEMGGKDSIIVDGDADLDAAVEGVASRRSAFRDRSARRARARSSTRASTTSSSPSSRRRGREISVGDPRDPKNFMGPVVNEAAHKIDLGLHRDR